MVKGTVLVVGSKSREMEIFMDRLEKERFSVTHSGVSNDVFEWLKANVPQAILVGESTPLPLVKRLMLYMQKVKKMQRTPVLVVAGETIIPETDALPGMGETLCLHTITLAEALKRLKLAIQLKSLVTI